MRANIRAKLLLSFTAVLVCAGIMGVASLNSLATIDRLDTAMYEDHLVGLHKAMDATAGMIKIGRSVRMATIFLDDPQMVSERIAEITELRNGVDANLASLPQHMQTAEGQAMVAAAADAWGEYNQVTDKVIAAVQAGDQTGARTALVEARATADATDAAFRIVVDRKAERARESSESNSATYHSARLLVLGLLAAAIAIGMGIAFFISGSIAGAARQMVQAAQQIAARDLAGLASSAGAMARGDLTQSVSIEAQSLSYSSGDEMGDLARAFNDMIGRLQEVGTAFDEATTRMRDAVSSVRHGADSVTESSMQLSQASEQTGMATQQVAQTIEQVAKGSGATAESVGEANRGMEELNRAIDGIAKGAQESAGAVGVMSVSAGSVAEAAQSIEQRVGVAREEADSGRSVSLEGLQAMKDTMTGMEEIQRVVLEAASQVQEMGQRSQEIGRIVATIEDIAAQTNLLALNAQIEAARAGEQGRGFAVVADEVRKLAERSAKATQEIAGLIKTVQDGSLQAVSAMNKGGEQVVAGVDLARRAEDVIGRLQASVQAIAGQIEQISEQAAQLASASDRMVSEVERVSAVVEESSAATEEMAASSTQVSESLSAVAAVAEEASASSEEVSASAEELSAQTEEVVAIAKSLSEQALSLRESVQFFEVGDAGLPQVQKQQAAKQPAKPAAPARKPELALAGGNGNGHGRGA